ncbi:Ig-like domain-containing protein [Pedobacter sp.]|uniref:gliding motility protein GldB-related protein n=1 Tax=Pedobacter sp. TaxID=1411316 RepID=UPI0031E43676
MKKKFLSIVILLISAKVLSAQKQSPIYTADIDHFWTAYDAIQKTNDLSQKITIINSQYIDKGSKGLKAFMAARQYNDTLWVQLIDKLPKFWNSIRANTLSIKHKTDEFEKAIKKLKQIYPDLKPAEMYFTIGGLRSGGTVKDNMVLVGSEIATGNATTDVSEFTNSWLKNVFKEQSLDNIVSLNIHEYIHTQQKPASSNLLSQSIREGSCDFIAELSIQKPLQTKYLSYGKANTLNIKELFKKEMFFNDYTNWLYNGSQRTEDADLGYYVGYEICKAYYQQAKNKKQAIKDIIELDFGNDQAVESFLEASGFYSEKIDKKGIIDAYQKMQPTIVNISPFSNGEKNVDVTTKELRITFSKPMILKRYSISFSEKGKANFPITTVKGHEDDDKTLVLNIELKPQQDYEFIITNRSFRSKDGYPLKDNEYLIKFSTK